MDQALKVLIALILAADIGFGLLWSRIDHDARRLAIEMTELQRQAIVAQLRAGAD